MDALTWGCCDQNIEAGNYLKCVQCLKAYHCDCLLSSAFQGDEQIKDWKCPLCQNIKSNKGNDDSTPLNRRPKKKKAVSSPVEEPSDKPITRQDLRSIVDEIVQAQTMKIVAQVNKNMSNTLTQELKTIKDEMKDVKASMSFLSTQYEDIIKEHKAAKETVKELKDKSECMETAFSSLNAKINHLEQDARSNNIEIQCIPESKTEHLISIVKKLGVMVGSDIKEDQIQRCTRIAKINRSSDRPRSIIVQLNCMKTRNSLLANVIKFNKNKPIAEKLNTSLLGFIGEKKPIFVVEHLSPSNKSLHAAARQKSKELNYKYVWVRNGQVFMRKTDTSEYIVIRNTESLQKLS